MNTRNTTKTTNATPVVRALAMLEALVSPWGQSIVQFLLMHERASYLEIAVHTGLSSDVLEYQLELLCDVRLIRQDNCLYSGDSYEPEWERLHKANSIARQLACVEAVSA